jgi:hypothetical protein
MRADFGCRHAAGSILEPITFALSKLHAGSTLSGTLALSNSPMAGDTASTFLSFSDAGGLQCIGAGGNDPDWSGTALAFEHNKTGVRHRTDSINFFFQL